MFRSKWCNIYSIGGAVDREVSALHDDTGDALYYRHRHCAKRPLPRPGDTRHVAMGAQGL